MKTLFQSKHTLRQPLSRIAIAVAALALSACATMETEVLKNNGYPESMIDSRFSIRHVIPIQNRK